MGFRALIAILVATAAATAKVSANSHDEGTSVAALAININRKFQELFQRLDRLELRMNQIFEKENVRTEDLGSGEAAILNLGSQEGANASEEMVLTRGPNEFQIDANLEQVHRLQKILAAAVTVPACERISAHVPRPVILAELNSSQNISCKSSGEPLSTCLWGHRVNGTRQAIIIYAQVAETDGLVTTDGVSYVRDTGDLGAGTCTLSIESITGSDYGLWSCTLVSKNSTVFTGAVHVVPPPVNGTDDQEPHLPRTGGKCEDAQVDFLTILKQVFDEGQNCAPCPECDKTVKGKLHDAEVKLQRKQGTFEVLTAAFMAPSSQWIQGRVSQPSVVAAANTSTTFSCETHNGEPWSLCFWEQKSQGQRRLIVIDQDVGQTSVDGISFVRGGANSSDGKCQVRIKSVAEQDFGQWACTLVSVNGTVSKAELQVTDEEERWVYFTTNKRGISAYSPETAKVKQIVDGEEELRGITYDSMRNKLYWCSNHQIYRANKNGSEIENVLSVTKYGVIEDLAFDWITGNTYVATYGGYILACDGEMTHTFSCFTVLDGQSNAVGISLNSSDGIMYWAIFSPGSIHSAGMDGSGHLTLVTGLKGPNALTIDFRYKKLYWVDFESHQIQSSDLDGQNLLTIIQLPSDSSPWGITLLNDRIYWVNNGNNKFESGTKDGQDVQTLYTETNGIRHLVVVPAVDQVDRLNHCQGIRCSKLCVLTTTSYRCMP